MSANNIQGRKFKLEIFDTAASLWKVIGGIKSKDYSRNNPVEDATNTATDGNETESQYTGYSTVTMNASGIADNRATEGLTPYKLLATIAHSSNPIGLMRLSSPQETLTGRFSITSFGVQGEQASLVKFSFGLQSSGSVEYI